MAPKIAEDTVFEDDDVSLRTFNDLEAAPAYSLPVTPAGARNAGLCQTCVHDRTCTFNRSACQPILHCEEFNDVITPAPIPQPPRPLAMGLTLADRDKYPGLCMTCDHRHTCALPRPAGGVFHCEEFE